MTPPRAEIVVRGEVVVRALPEGLETAEAVAVRDGRVIAAGRDADVVALAGRQARIIDVRGSAVVPGLHDAHLHLAGLARNRAEVMVTDAASLETVAARVADRAAMTAPDGWILGRGWTEAALDGDRSSLEAAAGGRPAWLSSHDGHSAWVSATALALAGVDDRTPDPPGGRIERDASNIPTGLLRETARDLVEPIVVRPRGSRLASALGATLAELWALGITGVTDMGAYTTANGEGRHAGLGDDFSAIAELRDLIDGRLRLVAGFPAEALRTEAVERFRTGAPLDAHGTIRIGWAKAYADGALGSRTAALWKPYTCGEGGTGILRLDAEALDELVSAGRGRGIGLAVHAVGDRAVAVALDALGRGPARRPGTPRDRIEHAQLVRAADRRRFGALEVIACVQPLHAPADRGAVEVCWAGRETDAYATRSLARAGALLVFGSDAPVESVNPWHGVLAAVRRRLPDEPGPGWREVEGVSLSTALSSYTMGPASAMGAADEGHLHPGAWADLAVLSVDLATLRRADDALVDVSSMLTLVGGREVHRA